MAKKIILGESHDILKVLPVDILSSFIMIRRDPKLWQAFNDFVGMQKQIKLDQIYRLRRPKSVDDAVKNAVEHDYHCGKIAGLVVLLQIMENAGRELEARERKAKKK